ncbi:DUF6473 family protein [Aliiroseovarius sp.]|uniref:DUF6473 family protein n=1 Tax=Aliiroseovarius sp. TaxID=1872442 RepID=UPI00263314A5|nr:DUF6473 family protein [Aliiroseovarius sp.]
MVYQNLGRGALDYYPCRYGKSKLLLRGPKRKLDGPYVAVLGGTETYGKFVTRPFPQQIEEMLDHRVVNFGCVNAGIDVYVNDRTILEAASKAAVTVVQLTGAQNLSNRFYAVHPRRNDRFLRASNLLKTIYRDVDFTEFSFTRHLLTSLHRVSPDRFAMVEQELKEAWVARMKTLISKIDGKIVLLWMADHAPAGSESSSIQGSDPLFVGGEMINELRPFVTDVVEVRVTQAEIEAGHEGMVYSELEEPAARAMLGTVAHARAADSLEAALRPHL